MPELFDIVGENDNVVGKATREEAHSKNLLHRTIQVVVLNSGGEMLLQQRSQNMDTMKGYWSSAVGGHVNSGEAYLEAAKRELKEEINIQTELEEIGKVISLHPEHNQLITIFTCINDGPFNHDEREIEKLEFLKPGKIKREIRLYTRKFTPAFLEVFRKFCEVKGL